MEPRRYSLEYYRSPGGDEPVERWISERLSPTKRRAITMALTHILAVHGIAVCGTEFGRHLGHGLFEFRLRYDEAVLRRRLLIPAGAEPIPIHHDSVLLRVFCHAHGAHRILLLHGYDKGGDPSARRQSREIRIARQRLSDFRLRERGAGDP